MRHVPPALQAQLDAGVTTLCRCWVVTRQDGVAQGFTDHDRDLVIDGVTCRAGTGLTGSEATQHLGLAVAGTEVSGALSAESLNEDDLAAGHYDAAAVSVHLVDWSAPDLRVLLASGVLGEVRREGGAFIAEVRGLSHRLQEESGRLYTATCGADLGDARCGVILSASALRGSGTITAITGASAFRASGLDAFADGWFTAGRVEWTSGANAGLAMETKSHRVTGEGVSLELWQAMAHPFEAGHTFTVTAGCDKRFATCRDRFANGLNFRGFPAIPGNDFMMHVAIAGEPGYDGDSLT